MHLTGLQRGGSRLFIRYLSHLAFHSGGGGGEGTGGGGGGGGG